MKIIKHQYKLLARFTAKELVNILLHRDLEDLMRIALNNSLDESNILVTALAKKQSKLRDSSELWTGVFGLYQEFEQSCEFCFYLRDTYNPKRNSINTVSDLIKFKTDPPDIVILYEEALYPFELKRFFDNLTADRLTDFVERKILSYSEKLNFYITINSEKDDTLDITVFEDVHNRIKMFNSMKPKGKVCFTFNDNNKDVYTVEVYPGYKISKYPFVTGTEQITQIIC